MKESIKVAIAGATGYVGIELVKILSNHPKVKINYLCAQKLIGQKINKVMKSGRIDKVYMKVCVGQETN